MIYMQHMINYLSKTNIHKNIRIYYCMYNSTRENIIATYFENSNSLNFGEFELISEEFLNILD